MAEYIRHEPVVTSISASTVIEPGETEDVIKAVQIFGAEGLSRDTIYDIARETLDAQFGNTTHRRIPVFTEGDWENMRRSGRSSVTIRVSQF